MGMRTFVPAQYRTRPGRKYRAPEVERKRDEAREESGRNARQQFYHSAAWRRLAESVIAQEPTCRMCKERGEVALSECVDHIEPLARRPDLALERENLQGLCNSCHARKTRREQGPAA